LLKLCSRPQIHLRYLQSGSKCASRNQINQALLFIHLAEEIRTKERSPGVRSTCSCHAKKTFKLEQADFAVCTTRSEIWGGLQDVLIRLFKKRIRLQHR
jgi:hypothetical protein